MSETPSSGRPCPCRFGEPYDQCCGPLLAGDKAAATAGQLMRSRYTAFATGDTGYLLRTWHPSTRPRRLTIDPDQKWLFLEMLDQTGGGLLDEAGTVEFRAHYRVDGQRDSLHENSRFVRNDGRWMYVAAL